MVRQACEKRVMLGGGIEEPAWHATRSPLRERAPPKRRISPCQPSTRTSLFPPAQRHTKTHTAQSERKSIFSLFPSFCNGNIGICCFIDVFWRKMVPPCALDSMGRRAGTRRCPPFLRVNLWRCTQNVAYFKHFGINQGANHTRCKVWGNFTFTRGCVCDILFARAGDACRPGAEPAKQKD